LNERFEKLGWKSRKPTAVLLTSGDKSGLAGLTGLVRQTGCRVVAPKAALEDIRRMCPAGTDVLGHDELAARGWFDVKVLALGGRGAAPVAYDFRWTEKNVLVSGRIPVKPSEPSLGELQADMARADGDVAEYLSSLRALARLRPDLWLPAVPVHGQNANLYDHDWESVLDVNRRALTR